MDLSNKKYYPWLLVVLFSCLGLTFPAAVTQFSMVVGEISELMNVSSRMVLLTDTYRAVCVTLAMFFTGAVYRRLGLRRTLALGMICQIASQFLIPVAVDARSLPLLFVVKCMQGMNSVAFPLYLSTITLWVDKRYIALATAIFNGSFIAGGGVGAWVCGVITPLLGWRASFFAIGACCMVFAIPVLLLVRDKPREAAEPLPDKPGGARSEAYSRIVRNPLTWMLVLALAANTWVSQAINVDLSVYTADLGYAYGQRGNLMLIISAVTVVSSVLAGMASDHLAARSANAVRSRCRVMAAGYALAVAAAAAMVLLKDSFVGTAAAASAMMFGVSWSAGVFWALPDAVYSQADLVHGISFCSGASNIPNPIAPLVVGVLLGSAGLWGEAWMTCCAISAVSLAASLLIVRLYAARRAGSGANQ